MGAVGRRGWVAVQVGNRVGALGLMAACAGMGLMLAGKKPFPGLLACGAGAAAVGLVASLAARRWGEGGVRGLVWFNGIVFLVVVMAMVVGRMGWGHLVGVFAAGGS